ncbi:MAG: M48 family metalloprotease [Steroidobacteraceae bacterium]
MHKRLLILLLATLWTGLSAASSPGDDLPDMGSPANATLSLNDEYQIGLMIVRGLRDQGQLVEDPEINEYIQSLGSSLAAHAQEGSQRFRFFVVRDSRINAFALPGGFVGVNQGLILATQSESELASVLAHEIAHVTQRHIARSIQAQGRQSLASAAAILAAILIGATTGAGGDVMQGAIAVAQGTAAQQQINFTRSNEYEADRVGIGYMAAAGYDPQAMPQFFETMARHTGAGSALPEMLQTHPVTRNRIAESMARAAQMHVDVRTPTVSYGLMRERIRVITAPLETDPRNFYARQADDGSAAFAYGKALSELERGVPTEAEIDLRALLARFEGIPALQSALAQAQIKAGDLQGGMATFERALQISPRNLPLTIRYAEALMANGNPKLAHALLLDLFNNVAPTPEQIRLTALAAASAGDTGDAYFYMGEYHIASGDLPLAVRQFELALAAPSLTEVQRKRFMARMQEVKDYLAAQPARRQNAESQAQRRGR